MSGFAQEYAVSKFGKRVVNKLARKGITVMSAHQLPGERGDFTGEVGYMLNDNGTGKMRSYLQVVEMANA